MTDAAVHRDPGSTELVEMAIKRGEGHLADTGAFVATTGHRAVQQQQQQQGRHGHVSAREHATTPATPERDCGHGLGTWVE